MENCLCQSNQWKIGILLYANYVGSNIYSILKKDQSLVPFVKHPSTPMPDDN